MRKEQSRPASARPLQAVSENEVVPLAELDSRLGLGPSAIRMARRQGLKVHRIGRRKFVIGRDLITFLESRS
jgi:hypothetical protein